MPSESYIRGNITVTGHWVNPEDPSQEKTEEESTFTLEAIPEEYAHRLTDADVNKSFTLTLTCRGQTASVRCVVRDDSIRYTGMQVRYDSTPVYVTGDILYEGESVNDAAIKEAVTVDVYGRTVQGGQDVYLPDEKNYQVAFQEETGGVAKKREDGSDWTADLIYYGPGEGTTAVFTEEDAVRYSVREYCLTVMCDEETVLDTIYTDDKTVVLNAEYDGRCPYNEMVRALREDGRYLISEDGFLTDLFYGWSSVYPATAENREISYTFKNGQHTQVMYAIPLTPLLEEGYLVKMSGDDQVLCGYVPKKETGRLDVPYGITRVALDREFITSAPAESVTVLALSATVNSVDLSAAGQKFPKLAEYSVKAQETAGNTGEVNHIFCVKDGLLYSADGKMLWKVPAACQSFAVNKETETIAGGALADAARACDKTETLTVTMQAETPPELIKSEDTPVFGGADCQVQVKVPKTRDSVVEDLIYKRYLSAWGEIFDEELGETGAAAQCIQAAGGTEKTYENHGGDVYAVEGSERQLAFIDGGDSSIYKVPEEADGIEAYAFAEPGKVRFVRMGENVKRLAGNSLASAGGPSLQGVQIEGDTPMILGEYVAGETLSRELNLYISREQNEASGWIKRLTEDYGADAAARLLTLADGTLYVDGQGCVYISREDTEQALTLCGVPEDLNVYTAPEGCRVTEVAAGAFAWCSHLVYLELPDVTRVGEDAFLRCEDLEIVVLSSPELSEVENAFSGCDSLETVFMGKKGLSPVLPQQTELLEGENYLVSEQMIYEKKDDGSLCLRNVPTDKSGQLSLLDGTEEIGAEAFAGCARLTGVDAGQMQEIRRIGAGAFDGCHSLREAIIGEKCTSLGKEAFADCARYSQTLAMFGGLTEIGQGAFSGCTYLKSMWIPSQLREIPDECFAGCTSLRSVVVLAGAELETIGNKAFAGCTSLEELMNFALLPAVRKIGAGAFYDCTALRELPLHPEAKIVSLGEGAFKNCASLQNGDLEHTAITVLPVEAFAGCTSMETLLLPESLTAIKSRAVADCDSLREISIARRDDVVSVSADALSGTKENGHLSIYVPYTEGHGLRTAYRLSADWWWALLDIPTWQSPVTIIKDRVMEEETFLEDGGLYQRNYDGTCRLLQALSTDDGTFIVRKDTTEIAKDALAFCEDLSVLVLPEALTELPEGVLSHSRELEVLFVPAGLRLPSLSASLFGGEESSDSFALWVSADDQSYYEEAGGLPVRTYGRQGEVHGGVLYGTQEEEGESRILLQYVPRSFRGELHILLGTAEVADGAAKGCESLTAVSSTYTVERIGNEAFMGCTSLKYMDFTNLSVTKLREIRVVNKGADRCYVYVPETADSVQADYRENQDWQLLSGGFFGVRSYQFTDQSQAGEEFPETPDWTAAGDSAVSVACRQAEEVYRSFVYAHYLDVDETLRDMIERLFFSGEGWQQHTESDTVNIDDATARIRVMLAARARYKKETEEMPDGEDFVSWFLEEYREGNAVHFATAAVLAYRTLGVPARYVEGYYLNEDLAKQLEEEGADTCRLTGENAHAWAEIYIDGAGWSPVEVTPGFYRETYEPDYLIDVQEEEMEPTDRGTRVEADEIVPGAPERMKLPEIPELPWNLFGIFLFVLLILTAVGFLLELQRSLRITLFRREWKKHPEKLAALTYRQMCRMLQYSGVQGDFRRPYELAEVICKRFPGIREEEYFRIIRIMQRNIFGQKPLRLNERRLLKDFLRKLQAEIRSKIPFSKKLLYRYLYCH